MKSPREQLAFFESRWPRMAELAREEGAEAVLAFIESHADDLERHIPHAFARQGLMLRAWEDKSLDVAASAARGSSERLAAEGRRASQRGNIETALHLAYQADTISYNLAADLADCWPGGRAPLERRHFETGLAAAADCIRRRKELDSSPGRRSNAWCAYGRQPPCLSAPLLVSRTSSVQLPRDSA